MSSQISSSTPVVVIGAGPHGLSAVAHLRAAGVPTIVFGKALEFWRDTMPAGMLLRSSLRASSIDSPAGGLSLQRWATETGSKLTANLPLADFVDYGSWFQEKVAPDLDTRQVERVDVGNGRFEVVLSDGTSQIASRVVVAAGLGPFASIPPQFGGLPSSLVSHTSASPPLESFAGRSVAVIGAGQSALETGALLHEAGAREVETIARSQAIYWLGHGWLGTGDERLLPPPKPTGPSRPSSWRERKGLYWHGAPTDVGGRFSSWIGAAPDLLRHLPRSVRAPLTRHCIRPAGAHWLPDRLHEVRLTLDRSVNVTEAHEDGVRLRLDDGSERIVDRVVLGTGYKIDVCAYPFLAPGLVSALQVKEGSPLLGRGFQSSVSGLHFLGAPAAESFGPTMRFVIGTAYAAPALTQHILGARAPRFRWAF